MARKETLLGEESVSPSFFDLGDFRWGEGDLREAHRPDAIHRALLGKILAYPSPCFLLPAVLAFIDEVRKLQGVSSYTLAQFELWLNEHSGLSEEENLHVRAKIMGKYVPRDAYQSLFPIGMGKRYKGSHYVTGHGSPDLDTMVASFWGWVDAFAARVAERMHIWNVPGGAPSGVVEVDLLFTQMLGSGVFAHLAKDRATLSLSSIDLMSEKKMVCEELATSVRKVEHDRLHDAVVLVNQKGYYLGDWRAVDVEGAIKVVSLLNESLRGFASHFHRELLAFFGRKEVRVEELLSFVQSITEGALKDLFTLVDLRSKQRALLQDYLVKVFCVPQGLESTLRVFAAALKGIGIADLEKFIESIEALGESALFNAKGSLVEERSLLFAELQKQVVALDHAIGSIRYFADRLEIALKIKTQIFGLAPQSINVRAEVEEIRAKMGEYTYLTVTGTDDLGGARPLGVIYASDMHHAVLGTVTLRDFSNREETKIPSYFEIISVIDHHKSTLQTSAATLVLISDAQSSNVVCAELSFAINDRYGTAGMDKASIDQQLMSALMGRSSAREVRIVQRLLQKELVFRREEVFFIDPVREYTEYLHFLYAILDDTDLLSKASLRDVECVVSLLNRMKTIALGQEVEVIDLDGIPQDGAFAVAAVRRILQNEEMYSLYQKVYLDKEKRIAENLLLCAQGQISSLFEDTKVQNGCARVGQTKFFSGNYPALEKVEEQVRLRWLQLACQFYEEHHEVDLHLQMMTTVSGAKEVFVGKEDGYTHLDALWFWIPFTEQSIEHLKGFLGALKSSSVVRAIVSLECYGKRADEYARIFVESFCAVPLINSFPEAKGEGVVLKVRAGSINSRKAMISPYLPTSR